MASQTPSPLRRYLDRYATAIAGWFETERLTQLPRTYTFVLVIPAHDEPRDCLDHLLPPDLSSTLVILVVNAAASHGASSIHRTQALLRHLGAGSGPLTLRSLGSESDLLLVDCCTPGRLLPQNQGVGLARKVGGDLALVCIEHHIVASPWIYCTDADVTLPPGYFDGADIGEEVAVALYPFTHQPPHPNILHYELSLRYYVTQLARVGSPYRFHTIGSLLKIRAQHYAKVRGFPKRQAAEDFYMLNKLAKTGQVLRLPGPPLTLSSRSSQRVPFGTGTAMLQLAAQKDIKFYAPDIFCYLGKWLGLLEPLWSDRTLIPQLGLQPWSHQTGLVDEVLWATLLHLGLEQTLNQAYGQCRDWPHFQYFLWVWFDALRTLKFVHFLRDRYYPSWSAAAIMDWLAHRSGLAPCETASASASGLTATVQHLAQVEQQWPPATGPTLALRG